MVTGLGIDAVSSALMQMPIVRLPLLGVQFLRRPNEIGCLRQHLIVSQALLQPDDDFGLERDSARDRSVSQSPPQIVRELDTNAFGLPTSLALAHGQRSPIVIIIVHASRSFWQRGSARSVASSSLLGSRNWYELM
jgi:hypothetical protein